MMKVVWFRRAIWDLESAKNYITQDNPVAAQQVVSRIKDAVSLLSEQPGIGRLGRVPNTKELVVDQTPFILPYRVRDKRIEILRVLHAARRWPKRL
jgi:toxin ParE1/3/4